MSKYLALQTSIDYAKVLPRDDLALAQFHRVSTRTYYPTAEHRLLAAVLEDAVATLTTDQRRCSKRQQREFRDAFAWMNNYGEDSVLSFVSICDALAIDPDYLRQGLLRKIEQLRSGTTPRVKRHGRHCWPQRKRVRLTAE